MGKPHRVDDLEIEQSLDFQRSEWRAERVGWVAMAVVIVVAALGFFGGSGPFEKHAVRADRVELEYDRFARFQSPVTMRLRVASGVTQSDSIALWIARDYLDGVELNAVTPEPKSVESDADRVVYTFSLSRAGAPLVVAFHLTTQSIGLRKGQAGILHGRPLSFSQFTYP